MSFYVVFNHFSSFFEMRESVDSPEYIEEAVANLVEKAVQEISADGYVTFLAESETNTLPKVDDSLENPVSAIDVGETAAVEQIYLTNMVADGEFAIGDGESAAVDEIFQVSEPNAETSRTAAEERNSKIEAENIGQDEIFKEFYTLLKKFEFSLQYKYDFADVLDDNAEKENFQHLSRLSEKNRNKQRGERREDIEKRFQEKKVESLREHLKQKRFADHLRK